MIGLASRLLRRSRFRSAYRRAAARSRIVVSAGMPRSGSTWLYNAARLLLSAGGAEVGGGWIGDWDRLPGAPVLVLKVHDFDPLLARGAHVVLYSYRDLRDVLASRRRMFGAEPTVQAAAGYIRADRRWRAAARFTMRYESMAAAPIETLRKLAAALGVAGVDAAAVSRQLDALTRGGDGIVCGYDPVTLLHAGHITDGRHGAWRGWLDAEYVRTVERLYADWFAANGYPPTLT